MAKVDINQALRIYLGVGADGGVLPYGKEERVRAECANPDRVLAEIREVLAAIVIPRDLALSGSLQEIADYVEQLLHSHRPELDAFICRAVGNYVSFSYR